MPVDTARVAAAVVEILAAIGEDPTRPGLTSTPGRVADAYAEFFAGLEVDPVSHLADAVHTDGAEGELVVVKDIAFRSICEHHLLPFLGVAHVGYAPGDRIVGLGSVVRVVETLAARPQLQERLGDEIAKALDVGLAPRGVVVVLDAAHQCVTTRGPRQTGSSTVTVAARGTLAAEAAHTAVVALLGVPDLGRSAP